jgi:hypothetical protein
VTEIGLVLMVIAAGNFGSRAISTRLRREGYAGVGRLAIVRCRDGHLFTTTWVPLASLTAVRLGRLRFQLCPVGHNWTFVRLVRGDVLLEERREAEGTRDWRPTPAALPASDGRLSVWVDTMIRRMASRARVPSRGSFDSLSSSRPWWRPR